MANEKQIKPGLLPTSLPSMKFGPLSLPWLRARSDDFAQLALAAEKGHPALEHVLELGSTDP